MTDNSAKQPKRSFSGVLLWVLSNGPTILAVLGGAIVSVVATTAQLTEAQVLQTILALVTLIGASLLTEKLIEGRASSKKLDEIVQSVADIARHEDELRKGGLDALIIRRRDLAPLEERFEDAKRVSICGGSLSRLVNEYKVEFERLAQNGCHLRFLVADPDTEAANVLSTTVVYESNNAETYRATMKAAITSLVELAKRYPGTCEVRLCGFAPSFSIVAIDKGTTASRIQVELYAFRVPARDRPTLVLDRKVSPRLYEQFNSQFETMWTSDLCRQPK